MTFLEVVLKPLPVKIWFGRLSFKLRIIEHKSEFMQVIFNTGTLFFFFIKKTSSIRNSGLMKFLSWCKK
jgi:hypothetical protein